MPHNAVITCQNNQNLYRYNTNPFAIDFYMTFGEKPDNCHTAVFYFTNVPKQ